MKLSVVIPAMNEEDVIGETIAGLMPHMNPSEMEIVVVNDHSTDNTAGIVENIGRRNACVKLVNNVKTPGFANALMTGFEHAEGRFVVPFMADSCDDPATLSPMLEKGEDGYDLVCGSRYMRGGKRVGGPLVQGAFSRIVGITLHLLAGMPTRDAANAFKMYRREALLSFDLKEKGFAVSMEACVNFFLSGCRICDVPTAWYGRKKGASKFRLSKTLPYVKLYTYAIWKKLISR